MDSQGLLLCSRYAVAPNFFGYCGPDENKSLIQHVRENKGDKEVHSILSDFDSLFLNLTCISKENKIQDAFDKEVVEAYWIGNKLLTTINNKNYIYLLQEKFRLDKKLSKKSFPQLKLKISSQTVYPHHSFHVFNIFKRTGHDPSFHTLRTMDECRIGWGRVLELPISNNQFPMKSKTQKIKVKTKQLTINNKRLSLSDPIIKELTIDYNGESFIKNLKVGDWVSFHWGFFCDVLTARQVKNLEYFTNQSINFFNTTI